MSKKLRFLISVIVALALAAPASADELIASYEDSEVTISTHPEKDPTLTVARVLGGTFGAPPATDGDYILKWVWTDESQGENPLKIEIEQNWATKTFDLAPYNLITADVWFDEPNAQPATIGIWNMDVNAGWPFGVFWAPALSVPYGLHQWHTVEMDIGGADVHDYWDGNDLTCLFAFLFEDLAGYSGVLYTDNMWLRFVRQVQAWRPIPFDEAVSMDPNVDLSWEAGIDANSHDVYFGGSWSEVNDANNSLPVGTSVYKGNQVLGNTSYEPGTLARWKTYYWRIDEVNEPNVWKGDIWSFKTAPSAYIEVPLVSYEDSETHYSVWTGLNISGDFDDSLVLGDKLAGDSTWDPCGPLPPVSVPTASDGNNVLGLAWDNEQDLEVEHGCTFEDSVPPFTYDLYGIDEMVFDIYYPPNDAEGGFNPLPHVMGVFDWRFAPSFNGSSNLPTTRGEWHTIVIDVSHLKNTGLDSIYDFEFMAHGEDFDPCGADPNNWGALVFMDNLRLRFVATPYATVPNPSHEATGVDRNADLSWRKGTEASSHDVYLGTSFADVNNANTSSAEFMSSQPVAEVNCDPGILDPDRTYYWRIDEVNEPNVWKGNIWSFTTAGYSFVDDFDSYNSTSELEAVWADGTTNNTGSYIYFEKTITYDGNSMKYMYSNSPLELKYAEIEALAWDLQAGANWTAGNTAALVLHFYGQSGNDANEGLYVALKDGTTGKVAVKQYDGDMNDLKKEEWQQWNIRLQDFNDINNVDLSDVEKVYIGFGVRGNTADRPGTASGTVYFDEIMLHPPRCVAAISLPEGDFTGDCLVDNDDLEILAHDWLIGDYNVAAAAQNDANLVAWYKFEDNNFDDSSVNGNHGTPHGGIDFVSGPNGLAIKLNGFSDYVSIPDSNTPGGVFDINDTFTVSAWIKVDAFDKLYQTIIAKGDDSWRLARYQENNWLEFAASGVLGGADPAFGNVIGSTNVDDGQWHHVAGVYDGSKLYLYIDGILDNTEDASGAINNSSYNVYIGENEQELDRKWEGLIDDVRIYDYGLSHAEIVNLAGESEVYQPVLPPANLYDEESKFSKKINFKDYAVMADRWLKELLFPFE